VLKKLQKALQIQEASQFKRISEQQEGQKAKVESLALSTKDNFINGKYYSNLELSLNIMPSTNIPVIDEYYRNVDTGGLVDRIVFKSEFDRLRSKIETLWHFHRTPGSETDQARSKIDRILGDNLEKDKTTQARGLFLMERYIAHMRKYYEKET
jgi:hypothetical protein